MNTVSEYYEFYKQNIFSQVDLEKVQKWTVAQELKQGSSVYVGKLLYISCLFCWADISDD